MQGLGALEKRISQDRKGSRDISLLGFGVPYFNTFFLKGTIMK